MNPDAILPFAYELIWFSAGGAALYADPQLHLIIGGLILFGGLVGSVARNYEGTADNGEDSVENANKDGEL